MNDVILLINISVACCGIRVACFVFLVSGYVFFILNLRVGTPCIPNIIFFLNLCPLRKYPPGFKYNLTGMWKRAIFKWNGGHFKAKNNRSFYTYNR